MSSLTLPLALLPLQAEAVAVAGLLWRPLAKKEINSAAKQLLQQTNGEHWVLHTDRQQAQCGIAPELPSGKQYYSAALLLKQQLGKNWVAIFEWPQQQYLLFGVHGGQIVPGCDGLFASAMAVKEQFARYQALCEWSTCYAPAHLELGGSAVDLTTLLNSTTPLAYPLQSSYNTPKNRRRLLLGGGGLLLGALIVGYLGWRYYDQQQAMLRLAQQRLLQAQQQYQQSKKEQVEAVWRQQPAAWSVLQQCVQQLSEYPLLLGGWQLLEAHCTPQKSTAAYQRSAPSQRSAFIQAARARYPHRYQLQSAEHAAIQQPLQLTTRPDEQLQPLSLLANKLQHHLEQGEVTGHVNHPLAATSQSNDNAPFELTGAHSPLQLLHGIDLSGVVIQKISSTLSANGHLTWNIQGTLYGQ